MARDVAAYIDLLFAHQPTGPAWSRDPDTGFGPLYAGMAQEFVRFDQRVDQLFLEADPRTAAEMIGDWERVLGLPDPCSAAATSLSAREVLAWRKLAFQAGQTKAFYIALAATLGFTVEIHEFDPAVDAYDGALTALITDGRWRFVWRVDVLDIVDFSVFRAGTGRAGDYLREGGAIDLECVIKAARPAHTRVIFTYPEP